MQTKTISKTAFTRALSLARAHGHMWASHVEHPAVAAILAGPEPYNAAALTEAFSWAAAEDDQRVGGIGFSLSHTTSTGRLSWSVCPAVVSQGPYDTAPAAGDVDLTVSRPSLAWRVWSAQRRAAWAAESDDRRVGAELMRMLAPEPERGSMDVLRLRIPAAGLAKPRWLASPETQDIGARHLRALAEAAHAIGGTAELDALFGLVGELGDSLPANEFDAAGIVMSQAIDSEGRVITLDMWGQAHLDIHLVGKRDDEPLAYFDTGIWTRRNRSEFLRQLATPAFVERIVDRLTTWAGMDLGIACLTAELALAEVGAAAEIRPSVDGPWSVKVIQPGRATVDELPVIFSSED